MRHIKTLLAGTLLLISAATTAQCTFKNTAFNSGEFLTYNLYYNWKFVWVKTGNASLSTVRSIYKGQDAYRCSLTTNGNKRLDNFFVMRDTLLCYSTIDMAPLYFRKGANEGGKYRVDEVSYNYPNGKCQVNMHRLNNEGKSTYKTETLNECVFDMLNLFLRARSFTPTGWKKGYTLDILVADGNGTDKGQMIYEGKETVKADDGHKYRCLKLTYSEWSDKKQKFKKISTFFVTDDSNHIPVRIDFSLNFGSAKAYLVSMKGIRSNVTSKVN